MTCGNVEPRKARTPDEAPKVLVKPLPKILDELETNIRAAAEAAGTAKEAAKLAKEAAGVATKASEEAAKSATKATAGAEEINKAATKTAQEVTKMVAQLQKRIDELAEVIHEIGKTYNATIFELGSNEYDLTSPLQIVIEEYRDETIARIPELNLYASGDTDAEAINELKQEVIKLYEDLESSDRKLGPLPESWLEVLRKLIAKKSG